MLRLEWTRCCEMAGCCKSDEGCADLVLNCSTRRVTSARERR